MFKVVNMTFSHQCKTLEHGCSPEDKSYLCKGVFAETELLVASQK